MAHRSNVIVLICMFGSSNAVTRWPEDNYALPMSVYGCPDEAVNNWKYGYLNITFDPTINVSEGLIGKIGRSSSEMNFVELLGPYGTHSIQLNFCSRTRQEDDDVPAGTEWPSGQYGVYGTEQDCPSGFSITFVNISVPSILFVNKHGYLPNVDFFGSDNMKNDTSLIQFRICLKIASNDSQSISYKDLDFPTILLVDEESDELVSDKISLKQLYIETAAINGEVKRYEWISYITTKPKEDLPKFVNPDYIGLSGYIDDDIWILYDIGIGTVINGVNIWGEFTAKSLQQKHDIIPKIYVSDMKWSFLDNGAHLCLNETYTSYSNFLTDFFHDWILIKCLNKPVGRHITFFYPRQRKNMELSSFFHSFRLVQFITFQKSPRCNRPLGMKNGAILDFQLSSSSVQSDRGPQQARPQFRGWCAANNDLTPYLQVDFVAYVRVEGIQIDYTDEHPNGKGHFALSIEYGANTSLLHRLPQDFVLDPFIPQMDYQMFRFAYPLTTRYLRIYPKTEDSTACLKIEIFGCPFPDPLTRVCTINDPRYWFSTKQLYIPQHKLDTMYSSMNTSDDCVIKCTELPDCYSATYEVENGVCEIFIQSPTYSYRDASFNTSEAFIGVCETEEYLEAFGGYMSSFNDLSWKDKTRESPGVLVSPSYPFHYPNAAVFVWTISFDEGKYINLLFSNLSLNTYKSVPGQDACVDTIYLYPYSVNNSYYMYALSQYIQIGTLDHHPDDTMPAVLTASLNNQQLSYKIDRNVLNIVFRTCSGDRNIDTYGNGFRLLAYASDMPTCLHWGFHVTEQKTSCKWQKAEISSTSFSGIFFEKSEFNMWSIIVGSKEFISLEISDFDVGCETGTVFEVSELEKDVRYCNKQRPVYPIVSSTNRLQVKFLERRCASTELVEGFQGRYTAVIKNSNISRLATSEETDYDLFQQHSTKVCSEELNKCYIMLDLEKLKETTVNLTNVGWNYTLENICGKFGWYLVNVHSKLEQDFVGFFLQHKVQGSNRRHILEPDGYYGYAYLGLRRQFGKYEWNDGSPITYTAWAHGHPPRHFQSSCTRFSIRSLSEDIVWEAIPCGIMMADYGVCEYSLSERDATSNKNKTEFTDLYDPNRITNASNIEMSLYFQCGEGEMISILGHCDGKTDCVSKWDEENCDNSSLCGLDEFRCRDGKCLDISLVCDHHVDCLEREDEDCVFPNCEETEFRCRNSQCLKAALRCDGKPDCLDGEDELSCGTCNEETSFNCGDYSCIPLSYRCDGIPDCQSEEDEKNCPSPRTCQEWYDVGYRKNGIYLIHGADMECNFDEISSKGNLITKYHSIDYFTNERKRELGTLYLHYGSENVLETLINHYDCYQSVDQLCQPWIQELYEVDRNGTGRQNRLCQCLRWMQSFSRKDGSFEGCEGENVTSGSPVLNFLWNTEPYIERMDINNYYYGYTSKDFADIRIRINPVVCFSEFISPPSDIVCGNNKTAPFETRCLYSMTEFGTILGCRNLAHLQNCASYSCPEGFFKCPLSFCLENRFVCDGEMNCEHGEDEMNCGGPVQVCFDQYRCLRSNVCLSLDFLCDGYRQCPLGDDERFCDFSCPSGCRCKGMAADCRNVEINARVPSISNNTKSIDISFNHDFFDILSNQSQRLQYLIFLNISFCRINEIPGDFFQSMKNLLVLDLRNNQLRIIRSGMFINQRKLTNLFLTGNAELHTIESQAFEGLESLTYFELSYVHVGYLAKNAFQFLRLDTLDLTHNMFDYVDNEVFQNVHVGNLYLNETKVDSFDEGMFRGLKLSNHLVTDAYKFCCIRPADVPEENCYPQRNEFSSCSDLMRNDVLRALLWVIGLFSLVGNAASLIYRFIYDRERLRLGYGIFVSNLAIADFIMGVYLIIIASADVAFRGTYIYKDESWRFSGWCKLAGILSTVSSEASVLFICLITLDRILVIKYPFGQIRFTTFVAIVSSSLVWVLVCVIGILPVAVTSYFEDTFYSKSGVCLALPLTRDRPAGWVYSISIFIGFNFITFLAIAFGQWVIYRTITQARSKMKSFSTSRSNDLRVARNLLFVASTDFLCWFPVGILGILALTNHVIPGEVYAWTAVLVLPINSALNPFLYTLSAILGKAKFAPDTTEQTRNEATQIELIGRHYDAWNSKLFVQPSFTSQLLPLKTYLKHRNFKVKKCLWTTVTIVRCVDFLHDRNVSTEDLSLQNVFLKPASKASFSVVLSFQPIMIQKEKEKLEDIRKLGNLLAALLLHCNKTDTTRQTPV